MADIPDLDDICVEIFKDVKKAVNRPAEFRCFIEAVYKYAGNDAVQLMNDQNTPQKADNLKKMLKDNKLIARSIFKYEIEAMKAGISEFQDRKGKIAYQYLSTNTGWKKCVKKNKKIIDRSMCIFTYFLIVDNIAADDHDKRKDLFKALMNAAGIPYSPVAIPDMETAILYYIIDTGRPCDDYITLMNDWNEVKESYTPNLILDYPEKLDDMTYNRLEEIVEKGYDNTNMTRRSLSMINRSLQNNLNKNKDKCTVEDVFEDDTIRMILDSATRRKWYMLKMLLLIVDSQISACLDAVNDYDNFMKMKKMLWLADRKVKAENQITWKMIGNFSAKKLKKTKPEDIESSLKNLKIAPEKVGRGLARVTQDFYSDTEYPSFDTNKRLKSKYEDDVEFDTACSRSNAYYIRNLFEGKRKDVSRELLMFMSLVCHLYGGTIEYNSYKDYVTTKVLPNSRLPENLDHESNTFDLYYLTCEKYLNKTGSTQLVDKRTEICKISEAFEEYYHKGKGISVFRNIIKGDSIY